MKIGIIVAMDMEYNQLKTVASSIKKHEIVLAKCGIGKVNAALGAQKMINDCHPDIIISTGCAGGNGDDIQVQDVVVSSELTYHDVYCGTSIDNETVYGQVQGMPARYQADPTLLKKAQLLNTQSAADSSTEEKSTCQKSLSENSWSGHLHTGLMVTGDWFVDSKEKMRNIVAKFPEAKAVDMESCAIAQTCYINRVPFISSDAVHLLPYHQRCPAP